MISTNYYILVLKTLGPVILNAPGDVTAAVHGPAVGGRWLDQPLPSTIAGLMAAEAYRRGLCEPKDCTLDCTSTPECNNVAIDFHNIHICISKLLGEKYKLYTGLGITNEGEILVYTQKGFIKPRELDKLVDEKGAIDAVKPMHKRYVGIAIKPGTKTVRTSLLYTVEQILPDKFNYAAIIESQKVVQLPSIVRFGADAKIARPVIQVLKKDPSKLLLNGNNQCNRWILNVASPALLSNTPWNENEPIILTRSKLEILFKGLLGTMGTENEITIEEIIMPKTGPGLEVIAPGWCTPAKRPRYPMLHIPAGTVFIIQADYNTVERIVARGLGENTQQGWGTVAAKCLNSKTENEITKAML